MDAVIEVEGPEYCCEVDAYKAREAFKDVIHRDECENNVFPALTFKYSYLSGYGRYSLKIYIIEKVPGKNFSTEINGFLTDCKVHELVVWDDEYDDKSEMWEAFDTFDINRLVDEKCTVIKILAALQSEYDSYKFEEADFKINAEDD